MLVRISLSSQKWKKIQPFNNGWDPSFYSINQWSVLELFLKKQKFTHATGTYDYTAGEIRSKDFFSTGCYSVCMKASPESGVSSSFYLLNTKWDSPFPRPPNDNFHNVSLRRNTRRPKMIREMRIVLQHIFSQKYLTKSFSFFETVVPTLGN